MGVFLKMNRTSMRCDVPSVHENKTQSKHEVHCLCNILSHLSLGAFRNHVTPKTTWLLQRPLSSFALITFPRWVLINLESRPETCSLSRTQSQCKKEVPWNKLLVNGWKKWNKKRSFYLRVPVGHLETRLWLYSLRVSAQASKMIFFPLLGCLLTS